MNIIEAREEYTKALRAGHKEQKELIGKAFPVHPAVLEELITDSHIDSTVNLGLIEIPADLIVGTKTAGRITAFTPTFLPTLNSESEFANKWMLLCAAHLSEKGIREPIVCYEYLGKFYIQEGNKRVSVLRYFGAPKIPGIVTRLLPKPSEDPAIKTYYEFLDFYKDAGIYDVQFRQPGDYGKLLSHLGKEPGEQWTEREQKTFRSYFYYFKEVLSASQLPRMRFTCQIS